MCSVCSKRKAKTVINGPTSNFLTVQVPNRLPRRQEIGPGDCIEMIKKKRQRELMEDELSRPLKTRAKVKVKAKSLNMTALKNVTKLLDPGLSVPHQHKQFPLNVYLLFRTLMPKLLKISKKLNRVKSLNITALKK